MNPLWLAATAGAFLAGALIALQAPTNAMLSRAAASPVNAALVSFAVGLATLAAAALALGARPEPAAMRSLPWYAWTGGVYGAIFVALAAFAAPRLGVTFFLMLAIGGQLAMAGPGHQRSAHRRGPARLGRGLAGPAALARPAGMKPVTAR
jgi:transporter family-2 protein